ncbi:MULTISPECIES: hypothetical protein [unclassified Sphingopyxis]|uniref:hypothetical protein n=1 Tax=unclassified Sphingopyxis TaxID=2614943 RepID=UPI000736473C|nr:MULTISPECIES: hypothetical protein [unclassified Sphingopyxis]KTE32218.1 hypothetical protein ATE62_18230 [Sphingopyxis sp. HIX]KTE80676.1 hypothetical protein ATE72_17645 [Sphingopyxis sp. HXXIV]
MMRTLLGMFLALMLSLHGPAGCAAALAAPPPDPCASMQAMQADGGDQSTPDDKAPHTCERLCYLAGVAVSEPGLGARLGFPAIRPSTWAAARHDHEAAPATPPPRHV